MWVRSMLSLFPNFSVRQPAIRWNSRYGENAGGGERRPGIDDGDRGADDSHCAESDRELGETGPNAGARHMAMPSRTIPIGTSSTPVASIVSNTLCAPCQAYSIAGRSSGGCVGCGVQLCQRRCRDVQERAGRHDDETERGHDRAEQRGRPVGRREQAVQHEHVQGEQISAPR